MPERPPPASTDTLPGDPDLTPHEAAARQRESTVRWVRMIFLILFGAITAVYVLEPLQSAPADLEDKVRLGWWIIGWAIALATLVLLLDLMTPNKRITSVSGIFFGLIAGILATWALSRVIDLLIETYDVNAPNLVSALKVLMGIALSYLGISVVLQTQDDFRLVIPYVEFTKQYRGSTPLLLDTSALIDGRIHDIAQTGFIQVPVVIPQFVIHELQTLADSADKLKRARGRRGLEVIGRLQRAGSIDLAIDSTPVPGGGVDQQLVELAGQMPATIVTADTGLNKVATIRGVTVLNLNDLGNALRPTLVVGSTTSLTLQRPGEQPGQAVGFLDDGTMVVVEQASDAIGLLADVEVTGQLQTSAGRMVFARLVAQGAVPGASAAPGLIQQALVDEPPAGDQPAGQGTDDTPTITPPMTVRPPAGTPPAKTPFPPNRAPRNPNRNPRR